VAHLSSSKSACAVLENALAAMATTAATMSRFILESPQAKQKTALSPLAASSPLRRRGPLIAALINQTN
jgi:hypothetical protein